MAAARFVKSSSALHQLPAPTLPEVAFIGHSNVGKSSLINMITSSKSLALVSKEPGGYTGRGVGGGGTLSLQ